MAQIKVNLVIKSDSVAEYTAAALLRVQQIVRDTAESIQKQAIETAREDKNPATRDEIILKKSIKVADGFPTSYVYVEPQAENELTAEAYALAQEYGHPYYENYGFTPYMRPAANDHREKFIQEVREALG